MLMTAYAALHAISYLTFRAFWIVHFVSASEKFRVAWITGGLATLGAFIIGALGGYYFSIAFKNLTLGLTAVERYNNRPVHAGHSCLAEFEEVCGPRSFCLCWVFPCCLCFEPKEDGFYDSFVEREIA
jgi:hypothetical protein